MKYKNIFIKLLFSLIILVLLLVYVSVKNLKQNVLITFEMKVFEKGKIEFRAEGFREEKVVFPGDDFRKIKIKLPPLKISRLSIILKELKSDLIIKSILIESFMFKKEFNGYLLKNILKKREGTGKIKLKNNLLYISHPFRQNLEFNTAIVSLINKSTQDKSKYILLSLFLFLVVLYILLNLNNINFDHLRVQKNPVLITIFLFILVFPVLNDFFKIIPSRELNEKRIPAKKPDLQVTGIGCYLNEFGNYFSDNLGIRNNLIPTNNFLQIRYLKTSPIPKILSGRDGWMFLARENKNRNQIDYFRELNPFTGKELEKWRIFLEERYLWLKNLGIEYYFVIAPGKMTIYPEKMPGNIKKSGKKSRLDQLIDYMSRKSFFRIIDVRADLIKAKSKYKVYHKTGSHWNEYGAFLTYRKITDHLRVKYNEIHPLTLNDFIIKVERSRGNDFPEMLSIENKITEDNVRLIPKKPFSAYLSPFKSGKNSVKLSISSCENGFPLKVFFTHDSFITGLKRLLAETFGDIEYFWDYKHKLNSQLILNKKPDIVIDEMGERFLLDFNPENPADIQKR